MIPFGVLYIKDTHDPGHEQGLEGIHGGPGVGAGVPERDLLLELVGGLLGALAPAPLQALLAGLHARRRRGLRRVLGGKLQILVPVSDLTERK